MKANISNGSEDLNKMQQDAINRVREMQSKTRNVVNKHQNEEECVVEKNDNKMMISPFKFLLEDSDKTLILLLLIILINEESDMGLILALMYLVM